MLLGRSDGRDVVDTLLIESLKFRSLHGMVGCKWFGKFCLKMIKNGGTPINKSNLKIRENKIKE